MKSVLMSIQPEWCELIASGKKTVEVRKTRPKIETPFKCYIYCTKPVNVWGLCRDKYGAGLLHMSNVAVAEKRGFEIIHGKVIGEYVCDKIVADDLYTTEVCGEYWQETTCLTQKQLIQYGNYKRLYFLHISDLVIYDKPRELCEFCKPCVFKYDCGSCKHWSTKAYECLYDDEIKRPPQSWCYVEENY